MIKPHLRPSTITAGVWRLFAVATFSLAVYLTALIWNLSLSAEVAQSVRRTTGFENELRLMGEDLANAETGQRGYLLTSSDSYLPTYYAGAAAVLRQLSNLKHFSRDPGIDRDIEQLSVIVDAKLHEMAETVTLAQNHQRDQAIEIVRTDRGQKLMEDFRSLRHSMFTFQDAVLEHHRAQYFATISNLLFGSVGIGVTAVALLLFTALHTAGRLRRPIEALLTAMRVVAEGRLDHRAPVLGADEIGRLAEAFNAMAEQVLESRRSKDAVQAELERSNAELDNFAYVASHDLKAPLRGIRNLTEWIAEDLGTSASDDTKENLALLHRRVDRLDKLLESLLQYSRVGRRQDSITDIDTAKLVADIAEYLAPRAGFTVVCEGAMPRLTTARPPLEEVLRNLIGNALKHHDREQGVVTVSASEIGDTVTFRVRDDGPGIPPEFHEKVFQMFQTLQPRDRVEGSGMGLAIVKKTIESVGGRVRVESAPPARGTTFVFTWPKTMTVPTAS